MNDPRIDKLARVLVQYSAEVRPGNQVHIRGASAAEPLLLAVYRETLQAGGHPYLDVVLPGTDEVYFRYANDDQLTFVSPIVEKMIHEFDVSIRIMADTNTRSLSAIDPDRQRQAQAARRELNRVFLERAARGELRWALTVYPTEAYAQDADMSLSDYEDFVFHAGMLDEDDPMALWREISARQARLVDWLKGKRDVRVTGPNVDLRLSIEGRTFVNADGRYNFPDGEIFTGPVENSVDGWVHFTYPTITAGREVDGIRLRFAEGRVVEASATKNEDYLVKMLDTDEGARRLGEFAIGTNHYITRFTRNILFDEKLGGTIHMAVGASYPETGGQNESAVHWDMICDMRDGGEITIDGIPFYRSGSFLI